jgi:hypothetical protein
MVYKHASRNHILQDQQLPDAESTVIHKIGSELIYPSFVDERVS